MTSPAPRLIALKYPATCAVCGRSLSPGAQAWWDRASRRAECVPCESGTPADPWAGLDPDLQGTAGASARTVHQQKRQAREERIRSRHPKLGSLILVVTEDPASTTAWRTGAEGERKVGKRLNELAARGQLEVLHDRAVPGSRANIDHIVIGRSGIFVIDTKKYSGKVERRPTGSLFNPGPDRLFVNGRDRTRLAEAMAGQVQAVREALHHVDARPHIEITPVLCFVDAEWPPFQGPFRIGEVHVVGPRGLEKLIQRDGPVGANQRISLARRLAAQLPSA